MKYNIGIDIGGTNTDVVLVDQNKAILSWYKTGTTNSVVDGALKAVAHVLCNARVSPDSIGQVLVGTTHATNALLEYKDLYRVGVIRITSGAGNSVPSCYNWPDQIKRALYVDTVTIQGGFECHGGVLKRISKSEVEQAVHLLYQKGMQSCAIVGLFSCINSDQEEEVKSYVQDIIASEFPLSLSHEIGGIGFIERENATILNSALQKSLRNGFESLHNAFIQSGISAPLYFTQNNGTLLSLSSALQYPILTISSGPTNSFVGSTQLAGLHNAIVVDIGGTSTDVGIVIDNFTRRSIGISRIAGIRLNFPMPDVLCIALGGGSYVSILSDGSFSIGPESCAQYIIQQGQAFGGTQLTLTDIGLKMGLLNIKNADISAIRVSDTMARAVLHEANNRIQDLIRKIAGIHTDFPVILTGGGAPLCMNDSYIVPQYASVANAYGAAMAQISGTVDTVVSLHNRQRMMQQLIEQAYERASEQGADSSTLRIVYKEIIPYHYVPNQMARVKIVVAGKRGSI